MDGRQMTIDAVDVPITPYGPAGILRVSIGELAYFAAREVEPVELHFAAALAVEHEEVPIGRDGGEEVVESVGIRTAVGQ